VKRTLGQLALLTIAILALGAGTAHAAGAQGTYTWWTWPDSSSGYRLFEHTLTVEAVTENAPYFWAHQIGFKDGDVGYIGLQSNGIRRADQSVGKMAIFSLWNAIGSSGPACGRFSGEGEGESCSVAYDWQLNRPYRLLVWRSGEGGYNWWSAYVQDLYAGTYTFIGRILVPRGWGGLSSLSVMWTEYFRALASCADQPYSRVRFGVPTADGRVSPSTRSNELSAVGPDTCANARITNTRSGSVIHEMGPR